MFETEKSGNKESLGGIGLNIRTNTSPKVGQYHMCGGVSVLCWLYNTLIIKESLSNFNHNPVWLHIVCIRFGIISQCLEYTALARITDEGSVPKRAYCKLNPIFKWCI